MRSSQIITSFQPPPTSTHTSPSTSPFRAQIGTHPLDTLPFHLTKFRVERISPYLGIARCWCATSSSSLFGVGTNIDSLLLNRFTVSCSFWRVRRAPLDLATYEFPRRTDHSLPPHRPLLVCHIPHSLISELSPTSPHSSSTPRSFRAHFGGCVGHHWALLPTSFHVERTTPCLPIVPCWCATSLIPSFRSCHQHRLIPPQPLDRFVLILEGQ